MPVDASFLSQTSVAILSCNRREDLRETLHRLYSGGAAWRETVVADNNSSDGTPEMLRSDFPFVRVIALSENAGVAGLNQALLSCSGHWVLSLDDDSSPALDTWEPLAQALLAGAAFDAVTCSVRRSRREIGSFCCGEAIRPYLGLHQAGSLISRDLLHDLGGFDPSLFLWGVELDLAARAVKKGYRLGISDTAVVEHRCVPANRSSKRHAFYYTRNLLVFLRRHAPLERRQKLVADFLANVLLYSVLHRTTVYWQGAREAWLLSGEDGGALSAADFESMGPDLRLPFSFLG